MLLRRHLLALVLRVLLAPRSRSISSARLTAGVACWLVADATRLLAPDERIVAALLSGGWIIGSVLVARTTFAPVRPAEIDETADDDLTSLGVVRRRSAPGSRPA